MGTRQARGTAAEHPLAVRQMGKLGTDGELGRPPQHGVDVGVDELDDPPRQLVGRDPLGVWLVAELGHGRLHLRQPLGAVRDVVVERPQRVVDHRAVARPDGADLAGLGQGVQPVERVEVGPELTVGVRHHRGAAAEHGVPGEHGLLGGEHERQGVGRVAGGPDDAQLESVDLHHVTVAQAFGPEAVVRVQRAHTAAHPPGELLCGLGMVEVVMGEEYDAHVACLLCDSGQV